MKRSALLLIGVFAVSVSVLAEQRGAPPPPPPPLEPGASQADVDKALIAAPSAQRDQATVIKWKDDYTYTTLRKGTNRLVCYDRSGRPLQQPFSVQCTSLGNLDREVQNMKAEATLNSGPCRCWPRSLALRTTSAFSRCRLKNTAGWP